MTSRILFYFDGNSTPQINGTLGEMFNIGEQGVNESAVFRSNVIGCTADIAGRVSGYVYLQMPYYTSVRVDYNNMNTTGATYWAQLETIPMNPAQLPSIGIKNGMYLRTSYLGVTSVAHYAEQTLLDVDGPVILCGFAQDIYNYLNYNSYCLEGPYKIYYDSSAVPNYASSAVEDFIDSSYYFSYETTTSNARFLPSTEGAISLSASSTHTWDLCKFWPLANAPYAAKHLKLTWTNGVSGFGDPCPTMSTQTRALIWYYQ
jgi:hypothetical protein